MDIVTYHVYMCVYTGTVSSIAASPELLLPAWTVRLSFTIPSIIEQLVSRLYQYFVCGNALHSRLFNLY